MLNSIKQFLQRALRQPSGLEAYISSKNPQNAADVDHWVRVYTQRGNHYGL